MTNTPNPYQPNEPKDYSQGGYGAPPPASQPMGAQMVPAYANPYGAPPPAGPIGQIRSTGMCFLLMIVTLGIYSIFYYYYTHEEMKRHSGQGVGGVVALLLGLFVGIVMPFLTPSEVGALYARRGQPEPVTGITGLWVLLPVAGAIVWFVKTNGALNEYWASLGAQPR